ncbi:thiol reductant ABC exporter subunit CydC [Gluconacetobacter sp. 1b LMG 1731]|uniref:Thiol reductant ABC exporter subunit CydC n=1 Tax=Gluconacetobacter dulcium TaxID=2729096 RepID=A0A7W4JYH0_9PROT|nr:thiol reductant ABC exporter subunit CydC [Gluconacetobacter dulcium]MBB2165128.1 thiol reductant ABC exporter subunit CydC [Gluconacetobacter dulcium]MBB2194246.1 thiol reductant ABC exporter subunit CydC [Gluconacetobacter dulcium]MBB2197041.1 thiol reductant ABC exporter subunit CydC [Gluconacetobacter dulcium]
MSHLSPLFAPTRPIGRRMAAGLVLACLAALANFGLLALSGWLLAAAATAGLAGLVAAHAFNMALPAAGVRFLATLRILARYGERVVTHDATLGLVGQIRARSFDRLVRQPPAHLSRQRSGEQLFRFVSDTERAGHAYLDAGVPFVTAAVCGLASVGLVGAFVPSAGLVLATGLLTCGVLLPLAAGWLSDRATARIATQQDAMHGDLVDILQGADEIAFLGAEGAMRHRLDTRQAAIRHARLHLAAIEGGARALTGAMAMLTALGVLACASTALHGGLLSAACLPMLGLGALAAFESVAPLPAARQMARHARLAARRMRAACALPPQATGGSLSPTAPLDLDMRAVGMRYAPDEAWVLRHADLTIRQGERVALVGPSGAGKSTVAGLLFGFHDYQEGTIHFGGTDARALDPDALSGLVGVMAQDAHLFQGSIRRNLAMACPTADEAAMWSALETAQLAAFVRQTPAGLDTLIGEAGLRLSGGQGRRLALACVLLRRPRWLILDEPTEGLDAATERAVMTALMASLPHDATLLCITHRTAILPFLERAVEIADHRFHDVAIPRGRPR